MRLAGPLAAMLGVATVASAQAPPVIGAAAVADVASVAPGAVFRIAVRLEIPPGYHIGWTNPGQSGLPTTLVWRTPEGLAAGDTEWPYPERDVTAGFVSQVYHGEIVSVTPFRAAPRLRGAAVVLRGVVRFGLCGATCIPREDTIEVSLPVRSGAPETAADWRAMTADLDRLPAAPPALVVRAVASGGGVRLRIAGPHLAAHGTDSATFFPWPHGVAVVVAVRRVAGAIELTLPGGAPSHPARVQGVLVAARPWFAGSPRHALAVDAAVHERGHLDAILRPRTSYRRI